MSSALLRQPPQVGHGPPEDAAHVRADQHREAELAERTEWRPELLNPGKHRAVAHRLQQNEPVPVNEPPWLTSKRLGGSQAVISIRSFTNGKPNSSLVTAISVPAPLSCSLVISRLRRSAIQRFWPGRSASTDQTRSGVARMKMRRSSRAISLLVQAWAS